MTDNRLIHDTGIPCANEVCDKISPLIGIISGNYHHYGLRIGTTNTHSDDTVAA